MATGNTRLQKILNFGDLLKDNIVRGTLITKLIGKMLRLASLNCIETIEQFSHCNGVANKKEFPNRTIEVPDSFAFPPFQPVFSATLGSPPSVLQLLLPIPLCMPGRSTKTKQYKNHDENYEIE